jgi:hypothetical protein
MNFFLEIIESATPDLNVMEWPYVGFVTAHLTQHNRQGLDLTIP